MERTRTLIGPKDREHLARSLERLSAGLAIRREDGKGHLVYATPPELDTELDSEQTEFEWPDDE